MTWLWSLDYKFYYLLLFLVYFENLLNFFVKKLAVCQCVLVVFRQIVKLSISVLIFHELLTNYKWTDRAIKISLFCISIEFLFNVQIIRLRRLFHDSSVGKSLSFFCYLILLLASQLIEVLLYYSRVKSYVGQNKSN